MNQALVCVVTGGSRGVGRGVALALGASGATVYVTGRSVKEGDSPLPGTVGRTAADVTAAGGNGIAVACDHGDDVQVAALFDHVDRLPRDPDDDVRSPRQRLVLSLLTEVRLAEVAQLCDEDSEGRRGSLEALLDTVGAALPHLSELITRDYFSHTEARRPADF